LKEVAARAGRKVLMEVVDNVSLIVDNLQGILDEQLRPSQIHLLYVINTIVK
jgi:hypothetical protein